MAKVTIDNLDKEIERILSEYTLEVTDDLKDATKEVTKAGVKAVKAGAKSKFKGTGRYSKGWTSRLETGRLSAQGTIYNKDVPGLPHLLENGHAKRGGGRVQGRAHIKPVEVMIVEEFERKVRAAIS